MLKLKFYCMKVDPEEATTIYTYHYVLWAWQKDKKLNDPILLTVLAGLKVHSQKYVDENRSYEGILIACFSFVLLEY